MPKSVKKIPAEYVIEQIGGGVICPRCGCGDSKRTTPRLCPHCGVMEVLDPIETVTRYIPGYVEVICDCGETVICDGFTNTCDRCGRDYSWNGTLLAPRSQWGEETGEIEADIMGPSQEDSF